MIRYTTSRAGTGGRMPQPVPWQVATPIAGACGAPQLLHLSRFKRDTLTPSPISQSTGAETNSVVSWPHGIVIGTDSAALLVFGVAVEAVTVTVLVVDEPPHPTSPARTVVT